MHCCKWISILCATFFCSNVIAEGYVLGIGADADTADGKSLTLFGDVSVGENTWLSALASVSQFDSRGVERNTLLADAALDHFFEPVGIRIGGTYWGDPDILDSRDLHGSLYVRGEPGSLALNFERRNFEFDLQSDLLRGRTVSFDAIGWGLSSRLALNDDVDIFLSGMRYDYSRNLRIQPDIDILRYLASSRLSMINSLVDDRISVGLEYRWGLKTMDITAGRWQTAVDGADVDSVSIGYLTPVGERLDLELRLAVDESESFGHSTALSVYLYFFGDQAI